uniref:Uncharacterized protein n=1 Tax=Castor canadensis TaxID=51338 RepID=A0A8C0X1D4_CASCN
MGLGTKVLSRFPGSSQAGGSSVPLTPPTSTLLCPKAQEMEKLLLPTVDLEQWYQELMAGLGTGPVAVSPRSSPPPLPAKASRQLQVYRSKMDGEATSPLPRTRSGPLPSSSGSSSSSSQLSVATLGRSPSPKSAVLAPNGTGSLPRNLAATLQDIETKRQLALQQKGEWLQCQLPRSLRNPTCLIHAHIFHRLFFPLIGIGVGAERI